MAIYRGPWGPPGPKPPKSQKKVPRGPPESGKSLEKVSKKSGKSPERSRKDFFETFPDSRGPGRLFQTFSGFRARRARETPVNRHQKASFLSPIPQCPGWLEHTSQSHFKKGAYDKSWWPKSRDATAMCDAIRIAHPQTASDATKFFASDAKTYSLDLKSS